MVLAAPVLVGTNPIPARISRPAQLPSPWITVIAVGGLDTIDGLPVTDPTADITREETSIGKVAQRGTTLRIRMRYDDADASLTTDLVISVWGRYDNTNAWMRLLTKAGALTTTIVTDYTNDAEDGTDAYTTPHQETMAFDLEGCDEFIVGVEVIYAVSSGNAALASLQAKVI